MDCYVYVFAALLLALTYPLYKWAERRDKAK